MTSIYNSQDSFYKTPYGAVRAGQTVTFRLAVPCEYGCTTPYLIWNRDGGEPVMQPLSKEQTRDGRDLFSCALAFGEAGLYFYYFDLYTGYRKLYRGPLGECTMTTGTGESYQLTVFEADFETPRAVAGGVMYQIFPDRFCEGVKNKVMPFADRIYRPNKHGEPYFWPTEQADGYLNKDYFGGDLEGIRQKLPYLEELGVTLVYLNPVVGMGLKHRVQVQKSHAQISQIRQLLADALQVAAEIVLVQMAVRLFGGPEVRLPVLVGPINAVCKRHHFVFYTLAEPVGKNLIHHAAGHVAGRLKIRFKNRQLVAFTGAGGHEALAQRAPEQLAVFCVQVKVVKVQTGLGKAQRAGKQVPAVPGGFFLQKLHHRLAPVPVPDQVRRSAAEIAGHGQPERDGLNGAHGSVRGFVKAVLAVVNRRHTVGGSFGK